MYAIPLDFDAIHLRLLAPAASASIATSIPPLPPPCPPSPHLPSASIHIIVSHSAVSCSAAVPPPLPSSTVHLNPHPCLLLILRHRFHPHCRVLCHIHHLLLHILPLFRCHPFLLHHLCHPILKKEMIRNGNDI